tara:strand:- start:2016 stop:2942 length:927 start_codon:yes stop_codon:yes gene_type:complete
MQHFDKRVIPPNAKDFYKENGLIRPPEIATVDIPKRFYRYVIDSRDRNHTCFPSPNKYQLKLSENIHDVQSVELVSFNVPFTKYLVTEGNNDFTFTQDGVEKSFDVDEGDYNNIDELCNELNQKLSSVQAPFRFNINSKQQKLVIDVTENITPESVVILNEGPRERKNDYDQLSVTYKSKLMKMIGFKPEDHTINIVDITQGFTLPYKVDLRKDEYIIMNLGKSSVNFSENTTTHKSFALIKKDDLENKFIDSNYVKHYNPPIPAMNTLDISFTDYEGNLYDFQNQDHFIELKFCCFKNQRKYADIFS